MAKYFDETKWDRLINRPDWYMGEVWEEIKSLASLPVEEDLRRKFRVEIRNYFADKLAAGEVSLGSGNVDMDSERQRLEYMVIHHTSSNEPYSLKYLNTVHLLNIYVPYFRNPLLDSEKKFKGTPLQSGHFYKGSQVFWGYHWFISFDGRAQRILPDNAIGWHSGNWDINRRSIGICLDGDFRGKEPLPPQLEALATVITDNYSSIDSDNIIGHYKANPETDCPGDTFESWRLKLVKTL